MSLDNEQWLIIHVDRASRTLGVGIRLTLQSPTGKQIKQFVCLNFPTSNNEVEYETILVGLNLALILLTRKVEVKSDLQLVVDQIQREYEANILL